MMVWLLWLVGFLALLGLCFVGFAVWMCLALDWHEDEVC